MICLHQLICQLHMLVKINSLFDKREIIKNFRLYIKIYISNESNNFFPYINFLKQHKNIVHYNLPIFTLWSLFFVPTVFTGKFFIFQIFYWPYILMQKKTFEGHV
ncbi:hypothetical protein PFUGPA_04699 [Plasmodium falciparum Palo Alto/Uganda]|uniref:Uncharacterized protein n=2 Tax=Plasmodium falciparum TaxID=5833 RepID=W4ISV9_PLAFP|nr:hypothetical protein PFUGPA_04699 [Plasmodium falciparum Palo Alto/Uganda]EUR74704.1 hypothetical protein PFBG_01536 [Plasmodium falciparum 7G8]